MAPDTQVVTPSRYEVLREVVKDYPGLISNAELLLRELNQHLKNWGFIVKEMRTYALKNFSLHDHHERGIEAIRVIVDVFLESLNSPDVSLQQSAINSLVFYLEKILLDGDHNLHKYESIFRDCFNRLYHLQEKQFFFLATNPHQLKRLGQIILEKMPPDFDIEDFNNLLSRSLLTTYEYWLKEEDPLTWFKDRTDYVLSEKEDKELEELLYPISHANLRGLIHHLKGLKKSTDQYWRLKELLKLPGYMQLARFYEDLTGILTQTFDVPKGLKLKMAYLLKIMETKGLFSIHESALREINRTLSAAVKTEEPNQLKVVLSETFEVLKNSLSRYPETALYCIQCIGNEIFTIGDSKLVDWLIQKITSLGFQYPTIEGVTDEWQVKSNKAHLKNIRVWLELIEKNPKWSKSLISALIINLRLGGVHINDTDLFQKDITKLLNSDIKPVYHLVKQLVRLFPVYFSEINAEGILREVSTEIDEVTGRADPLIHFLRKQSHVESSARIVDFIEVIIKFWLTKDKRPLEGFLPEDIFHQVRTSGPCIDDISTIFNSIFKDRGTHDVADLLRLSEEEVNAMTENIPHVSEKEKKRAYLAIRLYQLLNQKYKLNPQDIKDQLRYAKNLGLPNADSLISVLEEGSVYQRLEGILDYLQLLKDIILSSERYAPIEDIFRKRHFAAGIPSVYGTYHERKFDALSLTFRLENLANTLFEELIDSFNLRFITRASLFQIRKYMSLFFKALQLDGVFSNRMENTLELLSGALEVRRFSFSQYIDIFRGFSEAVQDILNTCYSSIHKNNLKQIIPQVGTENILHKYLETHEEESDFEFINKVSERFLREVVASSFGLQQLDNFISKILKTLLVQAEGLDVQNLDLLMSYDPKKAISSIHIPNEVTYDRIHLGIKGYNMVKLASLGIPIPPGFIITTEVFRCREAIRRFGHARGHLNKKIEEQIIILERLIGKRFGDPKNPLLVSVRSGGAISMPGMMNSFLNVGLNGPIVMGLVKQTTKPWFAWDCYRRFLQCWGMSFGMERDVFDDIINSFKRKYRVVKKIHFTPEQMKEVALAYQDAIKGSGIEITDDPKAQLQIAIEQVFQSWFSKKAQAYREILGLSENWGTAVIVQAMVYGNLDANSGTGVLFTRNPQESGDRVMLWGDFAVGSQGEDVVSGLVKTLPISNEQKNIEDRTSNVSLEDSFPEIYSSLLRMVKDLIYKERWGAQEIEFTFEGKPGENLYILQARDMTVIKRESFVAFIPSPELSSNYLSSGIGVGGGALSGRVVFDLEDIQEFRKKDPSTPLILIRSDTVPDDIRHISAADGLLTARGGSTSHAAIIANRLGKTCVVGCNKLFVWEYEKRCKLNRHTIRVGDFLSIDGRNGTVYSGKHRVKEIRVLA
ncbi:MAG: PEP/pyruvate-binding domain-containing protein [Thermodesulfovibrionales bacterium]|nr:PEP/pyruvate-binding domain-containing protein [Thermodesulfovibrionales bacterium]